MADKILVEYELVPKGGDKVIATVEDVNESLAESKKLVEETFNGKKIEETTGALNKFNNEVEKTSEGFTSAKAELNELTKQLTSGKLSGKDLELAKERAAQLKKEINNVRGEIGRLASDTRIFDTFVEGGRAVAASFSVAQGAAALFGEENKDLQKSILKVQGALALLTGAQELANIATKQGGIATQAYGVAMRVVDGIAKVTGLSIAASMAVATAGVTALVAGAIALVSWLNQTDDVTEEVTKHTNQFGDSMRGATRDAENLRIELEKSKGNVTDISAQLQRNNNARKAALEDANRQEKEAIDKVNDEILKADADALGKLMTERNQIRQDAEANRKAIYQKFQIQEQLILQQSEVEKGKIAQKARDDEAAKNAANDRAVAEEQERMRQEEKQRAEKEALDLKAINDKAREDELQARKEADEKQIQQANEFAQKEIERLNALLESKKQLQQAYFSFASSAASSLSQITTSLFQRDSQTLEAERERQLKQAGDNAKQREAIEKKFAIEQAKIRRKAAIAEKTFALFQIAINIAKTVQQIQATAAALAAGTITAPLAANAYAQLGLAIASASLQAAAVAAQPLPEIPRFKKGVIGFKGKGTDTSDENLVYISNNESVMTGKATRKYRDELQAAQDLELENFIYQKYLLPVLKRVSDTEREDGTYDDMLLRKTIKRGQEADRQNSEFIVKGIVSGVSENNYYYKRYFA